VLQPEELRSLQTAAVRARRRSDRRGSPEAAAAEYRQESQKQRCQPEEPALRRGGNIGRNIGGHRQHHLGWQQGCSGVLAVVMLAWPGLVVHVAYLGRSGQENATAPIQPPRELMVRTVVPGALTEAVMLVLDAAT